MSMKRNFFHGILMSTILTILAAGSPLQAVNTTLATETKWLMMTKDPDGPNARQETVHSSKKFAYSSKLLGLQQINTSSHPHTKEEQITVIPLTQIVSKPDPIEAETTGTVMEILKTVHSSYNITSKAPVIVPRLKPDIPVLSSSTDAQMVTEPMEFQYETQIVTELVTDSTMPKSIDSFKHKHNSHNSSSTSNNSVQSNLNIMERLMNDKSTRPTDASKTEQIRVAVTDDVRPTIRPTVTSVLVESTRNSGYPAVNIYEDNTKYTTSSVELGTETITVIVTEEETPKEPMGIHVTETIETSDVGEPNPSGFTLHTNLQTMPTDGEYITGITTEIYTSKEYEIEKATAHIPNKLQRYTTFEQEKHSLNITPTIQSISKNDSIPVHTNKTTKVSLDETRTTVRYRPTHADLTAIMRTDSITVITEWQTEIKTTMVPDEIIVLMPPKLLAITSIMAHSVRVNWRSSSKTGINHFLVECIGTYVDVKTTVVNVVGKLNQVVVKGLTSGERYTFRVAAVAVSGSASDWSNTKQADTDFSLISVIAESVQETSLRISFISNTNVAISGTTVWYRGTIQDILWRQQAISSSNGITLNGLYPGDLYDIWVTVLSPTNMQSVTNATFGTRPFPPTLEPITYYNVSSIEIGIKPPTNSVVHSFNVSIQQQNHTEIIYFHLPNSGSSVTNFVIPNLVSGGLYEISIACIGYGYTEQSNWFRIKHNAKLYAPMIQAQRTMVFTTGINLFWRFHDYIDCTHFLITFYARHENKLRSFILSPVRMSVQIQNLTPGETYTIVVKAVSGPEIASSQPVNITTSKLIYGE